MKKVGLILKLLATGTLTMLLTACYGAIQVMYGVPYSRRSGLIRVQRADTTPIPGIKVMYTTDPDASYMLDSPSWQPMGVGQTDSEGALQYTEYLDDYELLWAKLEDIDGEEHGGQFATQVIAVDDSIEDVTMVELEQTEEINTIAESIAQSEKP